MDNFFSIPDGFVKRIQDNEDKGLTEYRKNFMRDRDRILYCTAFRSLSGKTQIYTVGTDDHKKTRLTHSLEVAQISRTIAKALNLNEDLAEAIALGHDLGHTPFGHAGERMLHEIMIPNQKLVKDSPLYLKSFGEIKDAISREKELYKDCHFNTNNLFGFKHNIQSVRVAAVLEDSYVNESKHNVGLNLTNYTLWGMLNHSRTLYKKEDDFPNFQEYFHDHLTIKSMETEAWSFEAYIVRIADDIAQCHHDLEDALRGGALPLEKVYEVISSALGKVMSDYDTKMFEKIKDTHEYNRKLFADLSHIIINTLVTQLIEASNKNMSSLEEKLGGKSIANSSPNDEGFVKNDIQT